MPASALALLLAQLAVDHPGYQQLVNGSALTCGVPLSIWRAAAGTSKPSFQGRTGTNATLDDTFTAFRAASGIELVAPNCLQCHSGRLLGKRVFGLGNSFVDETVDVSAVARVARPLLPPGALQKELERFLRPLSAVGPHVTTDTVGVSAADDLAAALMAHRDPQTLAWRTPNPPLPARSTPVPVDIPAWWLARDKRHVFATGIGTGSRATLMAAASLTCTDSVGEAERVIDSFASVPEFVDTIEPPKWPFPVDAALAEQGREVFAHLCITCHHSEEVVPIDDVGTDPLLWQRSTREASTRLTWFNTSVYGRTAHLGTTAGYVAQPLRGVWATAPYFHNGSVPTLAAVLDSTARPTRWSRSMSSTDYDPVNVGWRFTEERTKRSARVYDTTRPGFGNQGHPFGDRLSPEKRLALLEYLKTL
jgi:mono/diheme cytochrome c family protein